MKVHDLLLETSSASNTPLFEKAALPKNMRFVWGKFKELKSSLSKKGLTSREIAARLNKAFQPLMVQFKLINFPGPSNSKYTDFGIYSSKYSADGFVIITLTDNIDDVLANEQYEDFSHLCSGMIAHDLKHREQVLKHVFNLVGTKRSSDKLDDFLSDHREMDAYVAQCLAELLAFFDSSEIVSGLTTSKGMDELMDYSEVFATYEEVFGRSSSVMKRFLKKLHSAVTHYKEHGVE